MIAAAITPCPDCGDETSENYLGLGLCWTCYDRRSGKGSPAKKGAGPDRKKPRPKPTLAAIDGGGERDAGRALARLLALDTLDPPLEITAAEVIGNGAGAAAFLTLSDGAEMNFASLREMTQPGRLMAEVVATTGAVPKLNQQLAMQAVALLKRYATHVRSMSETDEAIEHGVNFLQAAETLDADVNDQTERWGAFSKLSETDPRARHRESNISIAAASIVLRCPDGTRLVRTDWFRAHVRSIEPRTTPAQIAALMQRVGWQRRGKEGRWKATRPGLPGQLNWSFWIVPADWDNRGAVTAGKEQPPAPARPPARAHVGTVTSRNRSGGDAA